MIIFLQLILAHILGDFFLQPKKWVAEKEVLHWKSDKLYLHTLVHLVLMLFIVFDKSWIIPIFIIAISHLIIDGIKLQCQQEKNKTAWFIGDQMAHIIVIIVVVFSNEIGSQFVLLKQNIIILCAVTGMLFLTLPTSLLIEKVLKIFSNKKITGNESLNKAGRFIGILERLLVFIFILTNHWEAVGFLITAKSVFRFGDLKEGQDRMLTEYVLIGTLLSFGIAIIIALVVQLLFNFFPI